MKKLITIYMAASALIAAPLQAKAEIPIATETMADYHIEVNGNILESDFPVLNYKDRVYTSARLIAEALGATVEFDDVTGKITITGPEPEILEIIKEVIVEVPVYEKTYFELPASQVKNRLSMEITDIIRTSNATYVSAEVENRNQYYALMKYKNFYIEVDGEKYMSADNTAWANSISASDGSLKGQMIFEPIPERATEITLVLPFILQNADTEYEFRFDITL